MSTSLGIGVGWRPELALFISRRKDLGFVEVLAEHAAAWHRLPKPLAQLRERGATIVVHGTSMSLGGAEELDPRRVSGFARAARLTGAPVASEHAAFVRAGRLESGHLLPVPRTRDALEILSENIAVLTDRLGTPPAIENIATLFEWPDAEMSESQFLGALVRRTGASLLLDLANLHANARNLGWDPVRFLDEIPLDRIAYVHVAGGTERAGLYHDTHAHPLPRSVLELLEELCSRVEVPGVLLERDDRFPPETDLNQELDAVAAAIATGDARRLESDAIRRAS